MPDEKLNLLITADNRRFLNSFSRSEAKIKSFGKRVSGMARRAKTEFTGFGNKISGLTGIAAGLLGVAAGKQVLDFDTRLARLAIQAGLTKKQMFELKDELFEIGDLTLQAPEELLSGIEQIVEKTGDFKFAIKSVKDMGYVASATNTQMLSIGATASDLNEKFGITNDQVLSIFDILASQGKKGSFTLQNMAALFPRLLSAAARFDVKGVEGLRKFGAFLQIARRGAGSSEQAATAVERTFSDIISKWKVIRRLTGFNIFDKKKTKEQGRAVVREMDVVLKEIIKRTKGDVTKLQKIFGEESIRAITPMAQSFQKFGDFREFDKFVRMGGDGAAIMKDFSFWSDQSAAKIRDFTTALSKFTNQNLAKPIELLTEALDYLNKHPALTSGALYTLLGGLGIFATAKVGKGLAGVLSSLRYIMTGTGKGAATVLPMLKSLLTSSAAKVGLAGAAGYGVGTYINKAAGWTS